eukprot:TRINITY_DN4852_c0_g1_i4.p1 TRINITY_DN4852_c0_g1~~TRINITY_DN4852_c0_g1_i4.p1  ORF type:complete len:420 (+),score=97.56 TRINITY_DN4852_c0_g1_i4:62-1261(+)
MCIRDRVYTDLNYQSLGQIVLFTIYFGLTLNCFFAPLLVKTLKYKLSLILGSSFYGMNFVIGAVMCYCKDQGSDRPGFCESSTMFYTLSILAGLLTGMGGAVLWCAQSGYVTNLCEEKRRGSFFGVFWSIFQASQILGNVLSAVLLKFFNPFTYFFTLAVLALGSTALFCLLPSVPMEEESGPRQSVSKQVSKVFELMVEPPMIPLMAQMFISGVILAFYSGFFSRLIATALDTTNEADKNWEVASVFIVLGIGEVITGYLIGRAADSVDKLFLTNISNLATEAAFIFSILILFTKNVTYAFVAAFFWGFSDNSIQTMITAFISKDWNGMLEAFALYRIVQSAGACMGFILAAVLAESSPFIFIFIMIPFQLLANFAVAYQRKEQKAALNGYQGIREDL